MTWRILTGHDLDGDGDQVASIASFSMDEPVRSANGVNGAVPAVVT